MPLCAVLGPLEAGPRVHAWPVTPEVQGSTRLRVSKLYVIGDPLGGGGGQGERGEVVEATIGVDDERPHQL